MSPTPRPPGPADPDGPVDAEPPQVRLELSPRLDETALNALFAASWPAHEHTDFGARLSRSLLWLAAFRRHEGGARDDCDQESEELVGFVNVLGDGGIHAFVLDTTVHPTVRRQGVGVRLVRRVAEEACRAGARWLHVDHEEQLTGFYARCGFRPTAAGLRRLG